MAHIKPTAPAHGFITIIGRSSPFLEFQLPKGREIRFIRP